MKKEWKMMMIWEGRGGMELTYVGVALRKDFNVSLSGFIQLLKDFYTKEIPL